MSTRDNEEHTPLINFQWNSPSKTIIDRYLFTVGRVNGQRVLDFGSGSGHGCMILRTYGAVDVWGYDINISAVNQASEEYEGILDVYFTDELSDFSENLFDTIVSFEVFEHIPYKELDEKILPLLKTYLKNGGELIFSTPVNRTGISSTNENYQSSDEFHPNEMTPKQMTTLLDKHFGENWEMFSTVEYKSGLWTNTEITSGLAINARCFLVVAKNDK